MKHRLVVKHPRAGKVEIVVSAPSRAKAIALVLAHASVEIWGSK